MALQGQLTIAGIAGRTYGIIECAYEFNQAVDDTGKPTSRPRGGTITFVMPASSDDNIFFYEWMFHKTQQYDGVFVFTVYSVNNRRSYKTVKFKNAYCISLKDYFNNNDSQLMYTTVTLSAEIITVGGLVGQAKFDNEWK